MGTNLQKNAIMIGYINSYCLVCESYFDTAEETSDHIQEDTHADKLAAHPYLDKYGDNHIRKVNKGYFCEFCSLLLATAARVSLHVQEKSHFDKKGTFLLRRPSGVAAVIAFEDVLIGERAWHSLADETCAICNEEFTNENIHKTESGHLLKLVQSKVQFGAENNLYRTTEDSSFQCLTCNSVFALNTINEHFKDPEHKNLYTKCQDDLNKYLEQNKAKDSSTKSDSKEKPCKDDKKPVDKNQNNIIESSNSKVAKTNGQDSKEDKKETKTNDCKEIVLKSSQPVQNEATTYANENNLTYNEGNTNAFCRICETKLPATVRSMKEHVNGKEHKSRMAKAAQANLAAKAKPAITKRPMRSFFEDVITIKNMLYEDVVLNNKLCLSLASFLMLTKNGARFRCQVCEVNVSAGDVNEHADSLRHERAMNSTHVITSLPDSEFVREVRPNIYHCGFCNMIVPRWEEVGSHLQSREHKENKDACSFRLRRHLPTIAEHRQQQDMDVLRMMFLGHMFRRF